MSLFDLDPSAGRPITHFDLVRSLQAAHADEEVKGVVLEVDDTGFSMSQVQEICRHLVSLRKAGKDVWLYSDRLTLGSALFGAAASHFSLMPEARVVLNGLYAENLYFKGLFDMIGLQADVVHIGEYKSAGEMFTREGPSEAARRQTERLLDALYQQIVSHLAEGRTVKPAAVRSFIDAGFQTPEQALEAGLVDELTYRSDFVRKLRGQYGAEARFDRSYELPDPGGPEIDGMLDVFSLLFSAGKEKRLKRDFIAVVPLEGIITRDSAAPVRREILKAARHERCRGLVLRVDSPGGSALASEILWKAADRFRATGRPSAASMAATAASGGYYVSSSCGRIFAERSTITGSIGVVGMKLALGGAMDSLGITAHETKRGRHAGLMNTTRPFTAEERELVRAAMRDTYETFKQRVAAGRKGRLAGELEALAGGRVFTGARAAELGLVDAIGGIHEALEYVASEAGLEDYEAHLFPEPKDPIMGLFAAPDERGKDDEFLRWGGRCEPAAALADQLARHPAVRLLDPSKQRVLRRLAEGLAAFRDERVLLVAPQFRVLLGGN